MYGKYDTLYIRKLGSQSHQKANVLQPTYVSNVSMLMVYALQIIADELNGFNGVIPGGTTFW